MKIGMLGTGMVGDTIATKLIKLGHEVKMGSRTKENEKAMAWMKRNGKNASNGTFEDAAKFGEMLFLCTKGEHTLEVLKLAKPKNFDGKTVVDISNPLDFSKGMPPSLLICNTDSLAENIQRELPKAKVVKTLNIISCSLMVDPEKSGGSPTMFMSGNDKDAKAQTKKILESFGWNDVIDLGDIKTARGTEMLLPIWVSTMTALGSPNFAFKILKPKVIK